jgi:hypothetical protein
MMRWRIFHVTAISSGLTDHGEHKDTSVVVQTGVFRMMIYYMCISRCLETLSPTAPSTVKPTIEPSLSVKGKILVKDVVSFR